MPTDLQWSILWIVSRAVGLNGVFVLCLCECRYNGEPVKLVGIGTSSCDKGVSE